MADHISEILKQKFLKSSSLRIFLNNPFSKIYKNKYESAEVVTLAFLKTTSWFKMKNSVTFSNQVQNHEKITRAIFQLKKK